MNQGALVNEALHAGPALDFTLVTVAPLARMPHNCLPSGERRIPRDQLDSIASAGPCPERGGKVSSPFESPGSPELIRTSASSMPSLAKFQRRGADRGWYIVADPAGRYPAQARSERALDFGPAIRSVIFLICITFTPTTITTIATRRPIATAQPPPVLRLTVGSLETGLATSCIGWFIFLLE